MNLQDFRGTHKSTGVFNLWKNSHNDTEDTVKWIVKQPWSNGEVYFVGASADGIAGLVMAGQPAIPQIKKMFIIWATVRKEAAHTLFFGWAGVGATGRVDALFFFWRSCFQAPINARTLALCIASDTWPVCFMTQPL